MIPDTEPEDVSSAYWGGCILVSMRGGWGEIPRGRAVLPQGRWITESDGVRLYSASATVSGLSRSTLSCFDVFRAISSNDLLSVFFVVCCMFVNSILFIYILRSCPQADLRLQMCFRTYVCI